MIESGKCTGATAVGFSANIGYDDGRQRGASGIVLRRVNLGSSSSKDRTTAFQHSFCKSQKHSLLFSLPVLENVTKNSLPGKDQDHEQ